MCFSPGIWLVENASSILVLNGNTHLPSKCLFNRDDYCNVSHRGAGISRFLGYEVACSCLSIKPKGIQTQCSFTCRFDSQNT